MLQLCTKVLRRKSEMADWNISLKRVVKGVIALGWRCLSMAGMMRSVLTSNSIIGCLYVRSFVLVWKFGLFNCLV